jgi:hypothetical protein
MKTNAIYKGPKHVSPLDGLKAYGKPMKLPPVVFPDLGHAVELGEISKKSALTPAGHTHHFYPKKWRFTWCFTVGPEDFEFIIEQENLPTGEQSKLF